MNTGETIALIKAFGNGGGGSSLPSVTSADNGKVLTVEDGAWAADSNQFIVTKGSGNTADKTLDEVKAAVAAGKTVLLKYTNSRDVAIYAGEYYGVLYFVTAQSDATYNYMFYMDGGKSLKEVQWPKLPRPSASDNGSELIVKNGAWEKQQKKLVVTLTPTSPDFSGTMDKTPQEITAAYGAGQEIVFDIPALSAKIHANQFLVVNDVIKAGGMVYYEVNSSPVIITVATDSSASTYATQVFAMTPAS